MSNQEKVDYMSEAHSRFLDQIEKYNLGLCPHCKSDTDRLELLMIGPSGFIACHECECYWTIDSRPQWRLINADGYSWNADRDGNDTWLRSLKILHGYRQVVPFYHKSLKTTAIDAIQQNIVGESDFNVLEDDGAKLDKISKESLHKAIGIVNQALE